MAESKLKRILIGEGFKKIPEEITIDPSESPITKYFQLGLAIDSMIHRNNKEIFTLVSQKDDPQSYVAENFVKEDLDSKEKIYGMLKEEGFEKTPMTGSINPDMLAIMKYASLAVSIDVPLSMGAKEVAVEISKMDDSRVYMVEAYTKQ